MGMKAAKRKTADKRVVASAAAPRARRVTMRVQADVDYADPGLFAHLTEGERADALRIATEDRQLRTMAKVGRYRVITVEPLVLKPPHERAGRRLARIVIYDYASDKCVDVSVDLDLNEAFFVSVTGKQPMLAIEEEHEAIGIALADAGVKGKLALGDAPLGVVHYWSRDVLDLASSRRAAAVLLGPAGGAPALVVVVDLLDRRVAEICAADQW
jgi:hypothetical protein